MKKCRVPGAKAQQLKCRNHDFEIFNPKEVY